MATVTGINGGIGVLGAYPYMWTNPNNITPFTLRDGYSYLQILNKLTEYLTEHMIPSIDGAIKNLYEQVKEAERVHEIETDRIVQLINNRVGPTDVKHLKAGATLTIERDWPNNHVIWYEVKQDAAGGKGITLPGNVSGTPRINMASNAVSRFRLFPNGNDTWVVINDSSTYFNVVDYGAIGNKTTKESAAVKRAIAAASSVGGGTVYFPSGDYWINDVVEIPHNVNILGDGATLWKHTPSQHDSYAFFCTRSHGKTGVGSGGSNFTISGLTFRGDFANDSAACALATNNSQNISIFDCKFIEMQGTGHIFDFGGTDGVNITRCQFIGATAINSRAEAIQVDISNRGGISVIDDPGSYSGRASSNITVEKCDFLPLEKGLNFYPAPAPFGSHSEWAGKIFRGLKFVNNYVLDARLHSGALTGLIHFSSVDDLKITGNTFVNTRVARQSVGRVIGVYRTLRAVAPGTDPGMSGGEPKVDVDVFATNIDVSGNTFKGFDNTDATSQVIYIDGVHMCNVNGNIYEGCSSMFDIRQGYNVTTNSNVFGDPSPVLRRDVVNLNRIRSYIGTGNVIDTIGHRGESITEGANIVTINNNSYWGFFTTNTVRSKMATPIYLAEASTIGITGNNTPTA